MLKITICGNCKKSFWSKTLKMFVLWVTDADGNKLRTIGGYYSYPEADSQVVELKDGEKKCIDKEYLSKEKYCRECLQLVKRIKKRAIAEQKKRRKEMGIKGDKAVPISDADYKAYMKFLVSKEVEAQAKAKDATKA